MNVENIIEQINQINFWRLEKFTCGDALSVILHGDQNISIVKAIKNLVGIFLKTQYLIEEADKKGPMFFFMSAYSGRKDYIEDFEKVKNSISNSKSFRAGTKIKIDIKRIPSFLYWISWNVKMRKIKFSPGFRMICCNQLLRGFYALNDVKSKIKLENMPQMAITFCDCYPEDHLVTEYFNWHNVPTATLQHAVYYHNTNSFGYKYSNSRYFLGISECAKLEAIKSGYSNIKNFYICGPMKFINQKSDNKSYSKSKVNMLGVALSGGQYEYENRRLLECALYFSNIYSCKLLIRPHPTVDISKYSELLYDKGYEISKGTMDEFISRADMFVVGRSNVFADLISMGCIVLRMVEDASTDVFEAICDFKFKDEKDLCQLYCYIESNPEEVENKILLYKNWFMPQGDIGECYNVAINKILSNNII